MEREERMAEWKLAKNRKAAQDAGGAKRGFQVGKPGGDCGTKGPTRFACSKGRL